ncbi:MAG: hypothetical protein QNJ97_17925 [Myxococcota bacterium]|nr:hypothetical protein [Myxococcota bacterium]
MDDALMDLVKEYFAMIDGNVADVRKVLGDEFALLHVAVRDALDEAGHWNY